MIPMKLTDVLSIPGAGSVLEIRQCAIEVLSGPDQGKRVPFDGSRLVIGTNARCHLPLSDPAVSRLHAEVRVEGGSATIRDLQSSNGTFINAVRIQAAELEPGQHIGLGQSVLSFEVGSSSRTVELWPRETYGDLVGPSIAMRAIFAMLDRVARTEATVLVLGETGTGKDLVASALHESSSRSGGPFVVVDCGAIPPNLMEGELFGAVRGAFTGADRDRPGALEQAHGGTLFLDEVGELPLGLQPKLLRFLESRRVKRLGATRYQDVDVRVIAATNRPLHLTVDEGAFREDLYYRLNVVTVDLPPLRERSEDIGPLAKRFARRLLRRLPDDSVDDVLPPGVLSGLRRYHWPGNVRELYNHVQRVVALSDPHLTPGPGRAGAASTPAGQGPSPVSQRLPVSLDQPYRLAKEELLLRFELDYLTRLLDRASGNISAAARTGQMDRAHLYKLLRRHGLV